jgi:hypothetical protein
METVKMKPLEPICDTFGEEDLEGQAIRMAAKVKNA